jgi:hypothetical protein
MALLTRALEYASVRASIQLLTTLDGSGNRRDIVSTSIEGFQQSYSSSQLPDLQKREIELARRLSVRQSRKRVTPDFSGSGSGVSYV